MPSRPEPGIHNEPAPWYLKYCVAAGLIVIAFLFGVGWTKSIYRQILETNIEQAEKLLALQTRVPQLDKQIIELRLKVLELQLLELEK